MRSPLVGSNQTQSPELDGMRGGANHPGNLRREPIQAPHSAISPRRKSSKHMSIHSESAKAARLRILEMCCQKKTSHIGGAFSVVDLLVVLYGGVLKVAPNDPLHRERDRLFYSKGHACTALYSVLEQHGFFGNVDILEEFTKDGGYFTSHVNHKLPGVELSTGSLGHALGVGCGSALASKRSGSKWYVYVILSDGELDEGSNWEAILFAGHHRLNNLIAIIDYNKIQSFGEVDHVLALEPLGDKFRAFNWEVLEVDGHDLTELEVTLQTARANASGRPTCVIAHTIKGKGVSFMENRLEWHYRSPSDADVAAARKELEGA